MKNVAFSCASTRANTNKDIRKYDCAHGPIDYILAEMWIGIHPTRVDMPLTI